MSTVGRKFVFAGKTVSRLKKPRSDENQPQEEDIQAFYNLVTAVILKLMASKSELLKANSSNL